MPAGGSSNFFPFRFNRRIEAFFLLTRGSKVNCQKIFLERKCCRNYFLYVIYCIFCHLKNKAELTNHQSHLKPTTSRQSGVLDIFGKTFAKKNIKTQSSTIRSRTACYICLCRNRHVWYNMNLQFVVVIINSSFALRYHLSITSEHGILPRIHLFLIKKCDKIIFKNVKHIGLIKF